MNTIAFYQLQFKLILRPFIMPLIRRLHLMFQDDNAQPHVARICTQFLEAENIPVRPWPAYSPDPLSMFGMLWIDVYDSVLQFPSIFSNFPQPLRGVGQHSTGHNQQSDQLDAKDMCLAI